MQIMTRKQAIAAGLHKYFTGKPCRNGHTAERYTKSGTCEACLRGAVADDRAGVAFIDGRDALKEAKAELGVFNVRCYPQDLETIRGTALALARARCPMLTMADVIANPNPTSPGGGTALYKFRVHGADIDLLRGVAQALLNAHGANIAAARAKILADAQALANAEAQQLPEWKP